MKNTVLRIAIALSILCSACSKHSETPNEAATAIRDLIKEKKYDVLFSERYSEWYKVKEEGIGKDRLSQNCLACLKSNMMWLSPSMTS